MPLAPLMDLAFADRVDAWILGAIADGKTTFGEILCALPGVYPTEILPSLRRIMEAGGLGPELLGAIERDASQRQISLCRGQGLGWLPLPHPLDFEWRFSAETCAALLARAEILSGRNRPIALVGTPGLCAHLLEHGSPGRPFSFFGEDNVVTAALRRRAPCGTAEVNFLTCGAGTDLTGDADTIIIDPPWYADYIRPLFGMAASACRIGGHVLVSLPSEGVRPSARADRERTLAFAQRVGLQAVACEPGAVTYDTPFFEWNALAAAGIGNVPLTWRRGDLLVFERVPAQIAPSGKRQTKVAWEEVVVHGVRLRVKAPASPASEISAAGLQPVVDGDVLPSVSRRDPRRAGVDLWTSGNRVFRCRRPDLVRLACRRLLGEAPADDHRRSRDAAEIERIASDLSGVLALELAELTAFRGRGGWTYSPSARLASGTSSAPSGTRRSGMITYTG